MRHDDRIIYKCRGCMSEIPYGSSRAVHADTDDFCCIQCAEKWYTHPTIRLKHEEDEEYCKHCLKTLRLINWSDRLEYYPYTKETVTAWFNERKQRGC